MNKLRAIINDNKKYAIEYRIHAARRMFQRDILEADVEQILWKGDIIEQYKDDFPLPSILINGATSAGRAIHVLAAVNNIENIIVIITAYEPDPLRWSDNFTRRIK